MNVKKNRPRYVPQYLITQSICQSLLADVQASAQIHNSQLKCIFQVEIWQVSIGRLQSYGINII
jgi:hypothetical protein